MSALDLLEQRRKDNVGKQKDNAALYAGSPMYYYCHGCGVQTAIMPEDWYENQPPRFCGDCEALITSGDLDNSESYDAWLKEHDHKPVPR